MKNYVKNIIDLFASNNFNQKSVNDFYSWLVDEDKRQEKESVLQELWDNTSGDPQFQNPNAYKEIRKRTARKTYPIISSVAKCAAVIALLIATSITTYFLSEKSFRNPKMVEEYIKSGETKVFCLPDGTQVHANSETILIYPETFDNSETRTVFLQGEANFKVKRNPDQPFKVCSNNVITTALGTEFNISAYANNRTILTTLIEGKVSVECSDTTYILNPGEQVSYDKKRCKSKSTIAELNDITAWQKGSLVFKENTIDEILNVLERKFSVDFIYNESYLPKDKYSFQFPSNASLNEILEIMKIVMGDFKYEISNDSCVIK